VKLQKLHFIETLSLDDALYCKAVNTYCMDLMGAFLRAGACKYMLSAPREREMKHCHRYVKVLHPIPLPPL